MQALIPLIESECIPESSRFLSLLGIALAREEKNFHVTKSIVVTEKLISEIVRLVERFEESEEIIIVRKLLDLLYRVLVSHELCLDEGLFPGVKGEWEFENPGFIFELNSLDIYF